MLKEVDDRPARVELRYVAKRADEPVACGVVPTALFPGLRNLAKHRLELPPGPIGRQVARGGIRIVAVILERRGKGAKHGRRVFGSPPRDFPSPRRRSVRLRAMPGPRSSWVPGRSDRRPRTTGPVRTRSRWRVAPCAESRSIRVRRRRPNLSLPRRGCAPRYGSSAARLSCPGVSPLIPLHEALGERTCVVHRGLGPLRLIREEDGGALRVVHRRRVPRAAWPRRRGGLRSGPDLL